MAAGPPCQPFSLGGKHKAHSDRRDMFPATIDAVRKLQPRAFLVENVKGLARAAFTSYLQYTILQLGYPELARSQKESWMEHLARLEKEKTSGRKQGLVYDVLCRVVNAADYGIPQRRERVFIVGFRHDLGIRWSFPEATHSLESLLHAQSLFTRGFAPGARIAALHRPVHPAATPRAARSHIAAAPTVALLFTGLLSCINCSII